MGHERVGLLPKSKKWREIVSQIALAADPGFEQEALVEATARSILGRLRNLWSDTSVDRAFAFLVALTVASRGHDPAATLRSLDIHVKGDARPLSLAKSLRSYLAVKHSPPEYAFLAERAAMEALARYYRSATLQRDLFRKQADDFDVWRGASRGAGFCELARQFFASLTSSYFRYILEREASSVLPSVETREEFAASLDSHMDDLSRHAFETSKIAQSFAAGWYNRHAAESVPSPEERKAFLRVVFGKIRDSLLRETGE